MTLHVKKIQDFSLSTTDGYGGLLTDQMSRLAWHELTYCPWEEYFPYRPRVRFQIGHGTESVYLHYEVEEEFIKAQYIRTNENVWEDSCVEFFLSLDGKKTYYNVEFNVLGAGLVGYGTEIKTDRRRLDPAVTERIETLTQVVKIGGKPVWRLLLRIPKDIFDRAIPLNREVHANFYKCGDGLPRPHYLAWNNIENPTPNFHLPKFFGTLVFES